MRILSASSCSEGGSRARLITCAGLGLFALMAGSSPAQDAVSATAQRDQDLTRLSLEELMEIQIPSVTSASKFEQKITEAPAAVTVITSDDVDKYGYRTLADMLRSVRGFYVRNDRSYSYLGVRGFNPPGDFNGRFLLLVDGHRVNENIFDSALIGNEAIIDVDSIDRVEVIRGPSSSLYGNNAFFGVINIVTKTGHQLDGVEGSVSAGSFDTYKGRFSAGKKFENGFEFYFSGSLLASEGQRDLFFPEFDTPETNHGIVNHSDADRARNFLLTASYADFTLQGAYSSRNKDLPTASFGTVFNDAHSNQTDTQTYLDLKYQHKFFDEWDVLARVNYNEYTYDGIFPYNDVLPNDPERVVLSRDYALGQWLGSEVQITRKFFDLHTITVGAEYRDNITQKQLNTNLKPFEEILSDDRSSQEYGLYGQGEFVIFPELMLNAGVRFDRSYRFGNDVDPRIGLIYHPQKTTALKALYGEAFRRPNAYEAYYSGPPFEINPNLGPERIRTYEAVFEQQFLTNFRFTADAYHNEIRDLIVEQIDPRNGLQVFENVDRADTTGVEFELEAREPETGTRGRVSYTYQETSNADTGRELTDSPRQLAKLGVIVPFFEDRLDAGFELQYSSSALTLRDNRAGAYWLGNVTLLSQKIVPNLEVSVSIYNLFDQHYGFPGGPEHVQDIIVQDGRTFRVKATYRY
jgi:outer membrane receptor for ferrienterochelin and colicins